MQKILNLVFLLVLNHVLLLLCISMNFLKDPSYFLLTIDQREQIHYKIDPKSKSCDCFEREKLYFEL